MHPDHATPPVPLSEAALRDADVVVWLHSGKLHKAFECLVERYGAKVFHLCLALLGDSAAAEDVAQDSLLRVWRALASYDAQRAALSTWIYAITRNRCLTVLGQRQAGTLSLEQPGIRPEAENQAADAAVNDAASLRLLRQLVDALPTAYRSCLTLYYFEERSVSEVASMTGLPEATVKTRLHRARLALHEALQSKGLASAALWL